MRVLACDPGVNSVNWGLVEDGDLIAAGQATVPYVKAVVARLASWQDVARQVVEAAIKSHGGPLDMIVVERQIGGGNQNAKSWLNEAVEAIWHDVAAEYGHPAVEISAATIKQRLTGDGGSRTTKDVMRATARRLWGVAMREHEADAAAAAFALMPEPLRVARLAAIGIHWLPPKEKAKLNAKQRRQQAKGQAALL